MKVLILTNPDINDPQRLANSIKSQGDEAVIHHFSITIDFLKDNRIDFIVSDRHRHLIKEPVLSAYDGRIVNLHPSFLPWGRGYYPNFWSFVDDIPRGVTIHYINAGIDTGDIIYQKELFFNDHDTLRASYDVCKKTLDKLFDDNWTNIRSGRCPRIKQPKEGTLHYEKDFKKIEYLLTKGWDTPVGELKEILKKV